MKKAIPPAAPDAESIASSGKNAGSDKSDFDLYPAPAYRQKTDKLLDFFIPESPFMVAGIIQIRSKLHIFPFQILFETAVFLMEKIPFAAAEKEFGESIFTHSYFCKSIYIIFRIPELINGTENMLQFCTYCRIKRM